MMDWIRQYLLSVTSAAILCGAVKAITEKKGANSAIIKLLAGLFLTVTVIAPWSKLDFADIADYAGEFSIKADAAVDSGVLYAQEETAAIIKTQSEAYILDKAALLGLDIQAEVTVSQDSPPLPYAAELRGDAAPYAKERLTQYISEDLGIPEARQTWNSRN